MAKIDLDELDRLAREATSGPWTTEQGNGPMDSKAKFPTSHEVLLFADEDCDTHPIADFSCNHTCRQDYDAEANAKFVAALVTAWPGIRQLLRVHLDR